MFVENEFAHFLGGFAAVLDLENVEGREFVRVFRDEVGGVG
jgi:hypothetical protein